MDINGKWRIDAVMSFETQPDGSNWKKIDPNTDDEDMLECLNMFFVFDENEMRTLIRISPDVSDEEIEQAKKKAPSSPMTAVCIRSRSSRGRTERFTTIPESPERSLAKRQIHGLN